MQLDGEFHENRTPDKVTAILRAADWLLDLLGLPPESGLGIATGATMANFTALAAARTALLDGAGWAHADTARDRDRLDEKLTTMMSALEQSTAGNSLVNLTIALNYGGRDEVARATRRLAQDVANGRLKPEEVDEETLPRYLDTYVLPDPDLVIRTSGEARISNFLLWQSAYSEYEFIDTLWPDFTQAEFRRLCTAYGGRERRYGGVKT